MIAVQSGRGVTNRGNPTRPCACGHQTLASCVRCDRAYCGSCYDEARAARVTNSFYCAKCREETA